MIKSKLQNEAKIVTKWKKKSAPNLSKSMTTKNNKSK